MSRSPPLEGRCGADELKVTLWKLGEGDKQYAKTFCRPAEPPAEPPLSFCREHWAIPDHRYR